MKVAVVKGTHSRVQDKTPLKPNAQTLSHFSVAVKWDPCVIYSQRGDNSGLFAAGRAASTTATLLLRSCLCFWLQRPAFSLEVSSTTTILKGAKLSSKLHRVWACPRTNSCFLFKGGLTKNCFHVTGEETGKDVKCSLLSLLRQTLTHPPAGEPKGEQLSARAVG